MVDMGLYNIVHNDSEPHHSSIFNDRIEDWESDILIKWYQENDQRLLQKYKILSFLDGEDNQTYKIAPKQLEFKGPTRRNKQYCVVGMTLDWRYGDNLYLLISRDINDYLMLLIKEVEQDPDMGVKKLHPSIDDDGEAADSDKEGNNNENDPNTPYDGENMNASSYDEVNNDEDAPKMPHYGENINAYSNNEGIIMRLPPNHLQKT